MAFDGTEGEFIPMSEATEMTSTYQGGPNGDVKGGFLGKDKINELLQQPGAMGIRIYFGVDENGDKTVVLAAADADENDMTSLLLDRWKPCPPRCGTSNGLNNDR